MRALQFSGLLTTFLVHGLVLVFMVGFSEWSGDDGPALTKMVAIEASLAYKAKDPATRQPQKRRNRRARAAGRKARKASRNAKAPSKAKSGQAVEDFSDEVAKYIRQRQDDEASEEEEIPVEEASQSGGAFDGSEHGFAEISKGDPYMQKLAADAHRAWTVPTLERGTGAAVGCVRLGADGRIMAVELWQPTGNANIDRSVRVALQKLKKQRAKRKRRRPVPKHLMEATTQWTCFKFAV